ncbi:SRPBCC family protein [Palleronia abyssalis]|uniref:Polyketide cyclase / dehydrase and lipid transport n=1 Tax=Palleronia abyssalis TaxID=1501240 RepID=A0A2R8BYF6_9RHOB|nr:SRPBCC family protein [Palleronia abyssalis]SPJ25207.1 hypothetical protein PAA8504_03057 [Palleronia abyssalis]
MKFSNRTDIDSPPHTVFARLADFDRWETAARDRDIDIARLDAGTDPAQARWRVAFTFRGRGRSSEVKVIGFEQDQQIAMKGNSDGVVGVVRVELVEPDPGRTRMHVSIDLTPETIKARLLVQSLKLAKTRIEQRLGKRLGKFARRVEAG